ncbi:ribbon-helix-helix protein, CopG family [Jiangella aurantiaca]|nr:ribbon-helix-helix protein, CopG family [Jiangella aurantiaca]
MARTPRKDRGTAAGAVGLFVLVDPDVKEKVDKMAAAAGVSKVRLIEELVRRAETDADSRPAWWRDVADQQELPLKTA